MKTPARLMNKAWVWVMLAVMVIAPFATTPRWSPSAATGISLSTSVQTAFPNSMTFKVKAQSSANVTDLRLLYVVDRDSFASIVSESWAEFNPATTVDTQWVWDMRKSGLPPGASVEYWWTAQDAAGNRSESARATVSFDDTRYRWQSVTQGPVTLFWYQGARSFADALMGAAQDALRRLRDDTGAVPEGQVRIYIYASTQDLQGAHLFAQSWEGGVSFEGFGAIAIGVPPNELEWGKRAVPHELSHWVVGQLTFNRYGAGLPVWLEEGLATYGEGPADPNYLAALAYAINNNRLLSVRSLSSPFSADPETAFISYGQSYSIATFLIQTYGKEKMVQLLDVFRQGSGYDDALKQVYGFDQDGLDAQWRQSIGVKTASGRQAKLVPAGSASYAAMGG